MANRKVGEFPVKDKIVLITGGGSGIGLSFVKLCHSKGAKGILIGDLKLTSDADDFIKKTGDGSVVFTQCDVSDWKALRKLITTSVEKFGEVPDIFCPCAGIFEPPWSNFWDDTEEESGSYKTMKINVDHPIRLARLAFRALVGADKKGVIALVASEAGLYGVYLAALYCASKHAIVGLAKSLGPADEEEGVKVVCICPGVVKSPLWEVREDDKAKMFQYSEKDSQSNTPDEIAASMVKMIESEDYLGGTIMSRTFEGEDVVFKGGPQTYAAEGNYVGSVLDKERGVMWKG
jgi:NAD(P)-dependent dehydrogenase (short-subunit alcohol dehydrogenase family)